MPNSSPHPGPAAGLVDCDPELVIVTASAYFARNRMKQSNFIYAEITTQVHLKYHVQNLPKDGRGCPGKWLFEMAWLHFAQFGVVVRGIRGDWTFGDNLATVNRLTASGQMTVEDAAQQTWAFERASQKGFSRVVLLDADGQPGSYVSVDVVFIP